MNGNTRKIALTTIAFAATVALAAACGSKKSGGTPSGDVVVRGDGNPANFSCNHSFSDPAVTSTNVGAHLHAVSQELTSTPDLPGTRLVDVTPSTLATNGAASITDANGIGILQEPENSRYALLSHHDPDGGTGEMWLDTYGFNFLAPAHTNTAGAIDQRVIPTTVYGAFIGLLNFQASDLTGTYQLAGAVGDCTDQGAQIANATVDFAGGHRCGESHTLPCVAYLQGSAPNLNATHTDVNGAFVIVGLPANTPFTAQIFGVTTAGQAAEQIGELTVNGKDGTISLGASTPLRQ